jgi:hypothetical protein
MASLNMTWGDFRQWQLAVTKNGAPVDLTAIEELAFTLQSAGGAVFASFGIGTGVVVQAPASNGLATLTITPAAFASITNGNYSLLYTWSLIDAVGNPTLRLDQGSFLIVAAP